MQNNCNNASRANALAKVAGASDLQCWMGEGGGADGNGTAPRHPTEILPPSSRAGLGIEDSLPICFEVSEGNPHLLSQTGLPRLLPYFAAWVTYWHGRERFDYWHRRRGERRWPEVAQLCMLRPRLSRRRGHDVRPALARAH